MRAISLSTEPIREAKNLCMWQCPKCKCLSSAFTVEGLCVCGEKIDFEKWESYYAVELKEGE